ncbi:c-type cytochrome [Acidobacteria bacterium AH-259-D05]|nr:c-type cytochrome [Acidobacteria bacterium AH-259-D05]
MKERIIEATILAGRKRWLASLATLFILALIGITSAGCESVTSVDDPPGMILWATVSAETVPASSELLDGGRILYGVRCVTCHGLVGNGQGPASIFLKTPPRDFTQLTFKFRSTEDFPTDLDLFRSISTGFPTYGMPSFHYLPEKDRWALVYYLKNLARDGWIKRRQETKGEDFDANEASTIASELMDPGNPVLLGSEAASDAASLTRGEALYAESCLDCHGESGRGDGPSAATQEDNWGRPIEPRDFGEARVFRKAGWRPVDTVRVIKTGIGGTGMPAHPLLKESEVWDLARYVLHLREEALRDQ